MTGQDSGRIAEILVRLKQSIPNPAMELDFHSPFELLVSTVLSAQSTDKTVNTVTPALFQKFPDPVSMEKASVPELEKLIRPAGFFRRKAQQLIGLSREIAEHFNGVVPNTMDELTKLPGVGRKTASVVLAYAFQIPAIAVDTHVTRVSGRLGLVKSVDPEEIEAELCRIFPKKEWIGAGSRLLLHGRYVCVAKKPLCSSCVLSALCPSKNLP
ncbi:MAG: endonuclease III [Nitrospiraceae bacterium]|nr:endonuclease III [Nitrospiraceae bacterium]